MGSTFENTEIANEARYPQRRAFVTGLLRVAKPGTTLHELAKIADAAMTKLAAELPKEE